MTEFSPPNFQPFSCINSSTYGRPPWPAQTAAQPAHGMLEAQVAHQRADHAVRQPFGLASLAMT